MHYVLVPHIIGGALGIISGFVALFTAKGGRAHRRSGMVFVIAMLTMTLAGLTVAAARGQTGNMIAAVLTTYLVVTGYRAVQPSTSTSRRVDVAALVVALALAAIALPLGVDTLGLPGRSRGGIPAGVFFMFGTVAFIGGTSDVRALRRGGLTGSSRLARHLWRMCYALWIAALSFFIGQMKVIPKPMRIVPLLMMPPLVVLVMLVYWMWRVKRSGLRARSWRVLRVGPARVGAVRDA